MQLRRGRKYTTTNSHICFCVLKVGYAGPKYTKVRAEIRNKHNHIFYERKNYKIPNDVPTKYGWIDIGNMYDYS